MYNEDMRATIEELLFTLATTFIDSETPLRLIISDEDKWSEPLPDEFRSGSGIMAIDLTGQSLDLTYYDVEDDVIILTTGFNNQPFTRALDVYDIMGIVDIETGSPIMLKPFKSVRPEEQVQKKTVKSVLQSFSAQELVNGKDELLHSINVIKNHNPELFDDEED